MRWILVIALIFSLGVHGAQHKMRMLLEKDLESKEVEVQNLKVVNETNLLTIDHLKRQQEATAKALDTLTRERQELNNLKSELRYSINRMVASNEEIKAWASRTLPLDIIRLYNDSFKGSSSPGDEAAQGATN